MVSEVVVIIKQIMANKRSWLIEREQQALLQEFYSSLEDDGRSDIHENYEAIGDIEENTVEEEIMSGGVTNKETEEKNKEALPRKQIFKNMEEVLNETLYDDLPAQPPRTMIYQTEAMEKDGEVILWTTEKNSHPDSQQPSTSSTDVDDVPAIRRPPGKRPHIISQEGPPKVQCEKQG